MKCDTAIDLFLAYQDGDLKGDELRALEEHLASCDSCAAEWAAYQATLGEVSGLFRVEPSDGFTQRVKQTIGKRSRGRFFGEQRNLSISFAIVSFLLILLVLLAYLYISSNREIILLSPEQENGASETTASPKSAP